VIADGLRERGLSVSTRVMIGINDGGKPVLALRPA